MIRKQTSATQKKKNKKKHRKSAAVKISTYDEDIAVTVRNNFYKDITPPSETYAFDKEDEGQFKKSTNTSQPISYKATSSSTIFQKTEQKSAESSLLVLDSPKTEIITNNSNRYQTQEEKEEDLSFFDIENHDEILPNVGVEALPPSDDDLNNDLTFFELEDEKLDINNKNNLQIENSDTSVFDIDENTDLDNNNYFSLIELDDENTTDTVIEEEPVIVQEKTISQEDPQNLENELKETEEFTILDNEDDTSINEQNTPVYDSLVSDPNEEVTILEDNDSDIVFDNNEDFYVQSKDIEQNIKDSQINFDIDEAEFTIIDDTDDNEEVIFTDNEDKFNNEYLNTIIDDTQNDIINDIVPNIASQRTNTETLSESVQSEDITLENNSADIENEEVTFLSETNNINLYQRNLQYIQAKTKQFQDTNGITHINNEIEFNKQKGNNIDNIVVFSNTNIEEAEAEAEAPTASDFFCAAGHGGSASGRFSCKLFSLS